MSAFQHDEFQAPDRLLGPAAQKVVVRLNAA